MASSSLPEFGMDSRLGRLLTSTTYRAVLALAVMVLLATLVLVGFSWPHGESMFGIPLGGAVLVGDAILAAAFLAYTVAGWLIVVRRPRNRVGWAFLVAGLGLQTWVFSFHYAGFGLVVRPGSLPAAEALAWVFEWLGIFGLGLAFTLLLLVFPSGGLPSARWRPVAWFAAAAVVFVTFAWATPPGRLPGFDQVTNPVGIELVGRLDLAGYGWGLLVLAVLASALSLVFRFRSSGEVERRQIKWFAYAAALIVLALVAMTVASETGWRPLGFTAAVMFPVAVAGLPAAAFLAVFKHDLYQLELVVAKTIVYGLLAALITGAYVAAAAAAGAVIGTGGQQLNLTLAVVVTAVIAVVFQPLRTRLQRLANRVVYGRRATPYEVLSDFSQRIGYAYNLEGVLPDMARIITGGTGASRAEVWLVMGDQVRRLACWPPDPHHPGIPLQDGQLPLFPEASHTVEVRHRDHLLGAITLTMPVGQTLNPTEQRLVEDLAAQAGLILDNIRLIEELKASRQRIVAAQDEERRRLERDIHDGVQQQLLTLALALRTTATRLGTVSDAQVIDALETASGQARDALGELRRLARGIHPAIVTEGGITAALESLAERSPIPTQVDATNIKHLPTAVEITIYYLVAEGLTNIAKHASASAVAVTVEQADGTVRVEVSDDGIGGAVASGSGLTGLADRVAALAGRLEVDSPPGAGTRLRAEIPCGSS